MKITLSLRTDQMTTDGYPIRVRVYCNGKYTYLSTGVYLQSVKDWDDKRQRIKECHTDHMDLNKIITQRLNEVIESGINREYSTMSFIEYSERFNNHLFQMKQLGTYYKNKVVIRLLREYLSDSNKKEITFREMTIPFIMGFIRYMKGTGISDETTKGYLKRVKSLYNHSLNDKVHNIQMSFEKVRIKTNVDKRHKSLTRQEIEVLMSRMSEGKTNKDISLDIFLFQFSSGGMRVSDVIQLKWNNVINGRVYYRMIKTNKEMSVPVVDLSLKILNKYYPLTRPVIDGTNVDKPLVECINENIDKIGNMYIFPLLPDIKMTPVKLRSQISSKTTIINNNLDKWSKELGMSHFSSHSQRHTLTTLMINGGRNVHSVSQMLGHSNLRTTEHYISTLDREEEDRSYKDFFRDLSDRPSTIKMKKINKTNKK